MGAIRGWKGYVRIADTKANLANANDPMLDTSPLTIGNNLESIFIIGQKTANELSAGNQDVSGTIERYVRTDNTSNQFIYDGSSNIDLPTAAGVYGADLDEYIMHIAPNGSGNSPEFFIRGVKFDSYDITLEAGGLVKETAAWIGRNISSA